MKFRLDTQHYINDRLLEPGHVVGDETDVPFLNRDGSPMTPSVNMTPLDDEAWQHFQKSFPGTHRPERDPTKAIPLRGTGDTAKAPPLFQKGDDGKVLQPGDLVHGQPRSKEPQFIEVDKKGLPDPGSPNHPVGQPVIGVVTDTSQRPVVPPKPQDPDFATNPAQARADQEKAAAAKAVEANKSVTTPPHPSPTPEVKK